MALWGRGTRGDDELVLGMIGARLRAGSGVVGRQFGVTPERVRVATSRVKDADLAESGEDRDVVEAGYQWVAG